MTLGQSFADGVVRPTLAGLPSAMQSDAAVELLTAIAAHESAGFARVRQYGNGPARGFYQMEPDTLDDLLANWLNDGRKELRLRVMAFRVGDAPLRDQLIFNPPLATALARVQLWRDPDPLPNDIEGMARYWKRVWNTEAGRGTTEEFAANYRMYIR